MRYNGETEDSPILVDDDEKGTLVRTWNVLRAVQIIDEYCSRLHGKCWSCPLHVRTDNFEFVCRVLHKKWKKETDEKRTYDIEWSKKLELLKEHGWRHVVFGNNVLWFKKKKYISWDMLEKMSDQDFMALVMKGKE